MATVNEKMTAIADAIRDKTGGTEVLTLDGMAENIPTVYDAGKKAQYDEFWDSYQNKGARRTYSHSFAGECWNDTTFKPKYDLVVYSGMRMFYDANITNLEKILNDAGVKIKAHTSQDNFSYMFYRSAITVLPEIDVAKATTINNICHNCSSLKTIRKFVVSEKLGYSNAFSGCNSLVDILFDGVIGQSVSFSSSPLTVASMKSAISCLKDYSTESPFTYTLTLKDSCKTALEADTETVEFNGATYTYFELITAKGWNLA